MILLIRKYDDDITLAIPMNNTKLQSDDRPHVTISSFEVEFQCPEMMSKYVQVVR